MFTPNTTIKLLSGVYIDKDYVNTFTFTSLINQTTFFLSKALHTFNANTYQRKERSVRVPINIESLWNISYMMFQNTNFGNKWFYAFITDLKFVNDEVTEIFFEVDVMQTWYFDISYGACFIEREHVNDDRIGQHLLDEGLNVGDYVTTGNFKVDDLEDMAILISSAVNSSGVGERGGMITGVYSGCIYYASDIPSEIDAILNELTILGKVDAVTAVFMMPKNLIDGFGETTHLYNPITKEIDFTCPKNYDSVGGYVPKNNKLFVYPYNFLQVANNHGDMLTLKYELFEDGDMVFTITSDVAPNPTVILAPQWYKSQAINWEESLRLSSYPICNWNVDVYKTWLAQNSVSNALSIVGSGLGLAAGIASGNVLTAASGALGVANSIGQFYEKSLQPNQIRGHATGNANVAAGIQNFRFYQKQIRAEYAQIIDNYFDRFGYKVNRLKVPNILSRENWNYIKCHEVNIFGNIPNVDLVKIRSIFTNGITFWHNDNVGNYNRSNAITGGGGLG